MPCVGPVRDGIAASRNSTQLNNRDVGAHVAGGFGRCVGVRMGFGVSSNVRSASKPEGEPRAL